MRPRVVGRVDAPQPGVGLEVAPPGQRVVDDRVLEDDAADRPRRDRVRGATSKPAEPSAAGGRRHRRGEHADRGRLAGAVRTEQAEHFAGRDVEVDATYGFDAAGPRLAQRADVRQRVVLVVHGAS